jgi:hypothetical protein
VNEGVVVRLPRIRSRRKLYVVVSAKLEGVCSKRVGLVSVGIDEVLRGQYDSLSCHTLTKCCDPKATIVFTAQSGASASLPLTPIPSTRSLR